MYWYVLVCTEYVHCMYLYIDSFHRYLGLFGDHIVPAVLYRYTQVLRRPDLINSKGKALITSAGCLSALKLWWLIPP